MASLFMKIATRRGTASATLRSALNSVSRSPIFGNTTPLQGSSLSASKYFSSSSLPPPPTGPPAAASSALANNYLEGLNAEQLEAVTGPLVPTRVIAGPGSGKTKTLTSRIAHLISHHGVRPWQIVAITFTNKAAIEMRERLSVVLGPEAASDLFAGTFHSLCYRILLRSLSSLPDTGRSDGWSLYDQEASLSVIYKLVRTVHPEWKSKEARELAKDIQSRISRVKNGVDQYYGRQLIDVVYEFYSTVVTGGASSVTPEQKTSAEDLAEWFDMYEHAMRDANALDFDDLLGYTTAVLRHDVELRERLKRRWRHVLVDEFQDTNSPQYQLVKLLAGINDTSNKTDGINAESLINNSSNGNENATGSGSGSHVFVVGDTDQAIYGWRGADVRNMRTLFQTDFPTGEVYRLRDNYRSTPGILTAAQAVISRNDDVDRAGLRAHRPEGPPIRVRCLEDIFEEAESVARDISKLITSKSCRDRDIAVLFRTHMQARFIEQQLVKRSIPYVLVGGVSFWRRVEIQDILAYVRLAITLDDSVALKRIINVPKRGLGEVSLAKLEAAGEESEGGTLCRLLWPKNEANSNTSSSDISEDVVSGENLGEEQRGIGGGGELEPLPGVKKLLSSKATATVDHFRSILLEMREALMTQPLSVALNRVIELSEYKEHVKKGGCGGNDEEDDIEDRLLRLRQLIAAATEFRPGTAAGAAALDAAFAALELEEDEKEDERISRLFSENMKVSSNAATAAEKKKQNEKAITNEAAAISEEDINEDLDKSADDLLDIARAFLDEAALYSGADEGTDVDGVRLMTMHAAKGLEFEVVFVPGCVEGLVPLFNPDKGDSEADLEEETRLFFVSMTRAKQELRLFHSRMHTHQGPANRRPNRPSRYLADVVKSGHAVVEEEEGDRNRSMQMDARSRRHYDYGQRSAASKNKNKSKSSSLAVASTTNEWDSDSDWLEDGGEEDDKVETSLPLRPAQIRAQQRASRR